MSEEPVAYLQLDIHGEEMVHIEKDMSGYETKPLYTKEQLQPKFKMTSEEFDEFKKLHKSRNHLIPIHFLELIRKKSSGYPLLRDRYYNGRKEQLHLLSLWLKFDPDNPEETIEIVSEKKWFVRSKASSKSKSYEWLDEYEDVIPLYTRGQKPPKSAVKFETKEEAELWVNPLCEAILLPIDGSV